MSNEKEIIKKLLTIANNQQKIIRKIAATVGLPSTDPMLDYLERAVDTAATNAGIPFPVGAEVESTPGSMRDNIKIEGTYRVSVRGFDKADEKTKQKFLQTYLNQVKTQKPELANRVGVFFV